MIDFFKEKDKQMHIYVTLFIAFLATLIAFKLALEPQYVYGFVAGMIAGIGKEIRDYLSYGLFDKRDILADAIGSSIGAGIGFAWLIGLVQ